MLPKKNRVDKKGADLIFKSGKFLGSKNLVLKFIKNGTNSPRASITVPKSVFKKAVMRNSLRRKGYIILEKHFNKLPRGFSGMFIFNKNIDSEEEINNEIKKIFDKLC